jgi:tetratricopeptide (TPR) repeat protein
VEQAIEHISVALHKNEKLFKEVPQTRLFHCLMVNILAECLMRKEEFDDATEVLQKAIELGSEQNSEGSGHGVMGHAEEVSNKSKILLAQCYCRLKEYRQAIRIVEEVVHGTAKLEKQEFYAFALVEKAGILAGQGDYQEAIGAQEEAISSILLT